jgi:hypothetical protein
MVDESPVWTISMDRIILASFSQYDVCDVTLSVHPHRASWKVSRDLWDTSPMLCQLSLLADYHYIVCVQAMPTELRGQVGSSWWYFGTESSSFNISVFYDDYFVCVGVMYSGEYMMLLWVCIHTGQAEKLAWPRWEYLQLPLMILYTENQKTINHSGDPGHSNRSCYTNS